MPSLNRIRITEGPTMRESDEAYVRELIAAELAKERIQKQREQPSVLGGLVQSRAKNSEASTKEAITNTADGGASQGASDDELKGIREWIDSLPDDGVELLRCMEFDILCPDLAGTDGSGIGGGTAASSLDRATGPGGDAGSDVLLQLLRSQAPPPTPIHPRAVSYKSASCAVWGATDGRDEEERVSRSRFRRPRLFQLVERTASGGAGGQRSGRRKRQQRYDVIARKFITASGDVLSIGSTDQQRLADEWFIKETVVTHYLDEIGADGESSAGPEPRRRCHLRLTKEFLCSLSGGGKRSRKESVLRALTIVSRGRFLSNVPRRGADVGTNFPFCAPWLDPTSEWFSLQTFLASRFEAALWNTFDLWKAEEVPPSRPCSSPINDILWDYSDIEANRLMDMAIGEAFARLLRQEDTSSGLVRDGHIWRLIEKGRDSLVPPEAFDQAGASSGHAILKSSFSLPLIQLGSSNDIYRFSVLSCLKDCLAAEAEKNLLSEMVAEEEKKTDCSNTFKVPPRSRRSKKKRKKGRKSRGTPVLKRIDEASSTYEENSVNTNNTAVYEDDEALMLAKRAHSPPSVGANQNTIMVLQILDGILCSVFEEVGLGAKEEDGDDAFLDVGERKEATRRPQKQSLSFQYKRPKKRPANGAGTIPHSASSVPPSSPANHSSFVASHGQNRAQSPEDSSSISMLSYNTNPYHHPQSPHEHVFSFMDSSQSNLSNRPTAGDFHGYGSIFDDGSSPLGMALNLGDSRSGFSDSAPISGSWSGLGRSRDRSLFTEFFDKEDLREAQDIDEMLMAASTAASFASSNAYDDASSSSSVYDDDSEVAQNEFEEVYEDMQENDRSSTNLSAVSEDVEGTELERKVSLSCEGNGDSSSVASPATEHGGNIREPSDKPDDEADSSSLQKKNAADTGIARNEASASADDLDPPKVVTASPMPISDGVLRTPTEDPQRVTMPSLDNTSTQRDLPLTPSEPPPTPPPQLSPIQVSLADLGKFIKASKLSDDVSRDFEKATSVTSLPGSPRLNSAKRNWSRDDLTRLASMNDDTASRMRTRRRIRSSSSQQFEDVMSYRTALSKSIKDSSTCSRHEVRSVAGSVDHRFLDRRRKFLRPRLSIPDLKKVDVPIIDGHLHSNICAQSETALDGYEDSSHVNVMRPHEEIDNATTTRDGATTISSAATPKEPQEVAHLREERDAFRDLCLTLGAEVAKLKSTVAALQQGQNSTAYTHSQMGFATTSSVMTSMSQQPYAYPTGPPIFTPQGLQPAYAMSDAGIANETAHSEDGSDTIYQGDGSGLQTQWQGGQSHPTGFIQIRRTSCNRTVSNASVDHDAGCHGSIAMSALRSSIHRDTFGGGVLSQGLQSRLSIDINSYCISLSSKLKKQENRRITATKRLTRLVTALWPRAQVKLYGSHVTDLCLPSSDLDFVVCLPSVHKEEFATAPGVLEGRNAINESNQKLLARKLKGESWIDPRSIKVIERTAIPVIKVSTKDKRSRVIQLDISFDGPNHHGLEAIDLVTETIREYPVCRPLMLVLKQFLLDRGLLTAYTGGLSSYGLFLMLSRYLQEQTIGSWTDCGSLLIGFLDYFGNQFDPRQTGLSARNRQFFSRPYYSQTPQHFKPQQMWNAPPAAVPQMGAEEDGVPDLSRRHSFAEIVPKNVIAAKSGTVVPGSSATIKSPMKHNPTKPPRIQTKRSSSHLSLHNEYPVTSSHPPKRLEPSPRTHQAQVLPPSSTIPPASAPVYTFDPLMCEDPLNPTNNIGRNTFRIFQVLRAFSDAHRALVASLEWDMNLNDEDDFPLLKSLLQNEDNFFFESESHLSLQPN